MSSTLPPEPLQPQVVILERELAEARATASRLERELAEARAEKERDKEHQKYLTKAAALAAMSDILKEPQ